MRLIREAQAIRAEHHDEAMAKLRQAASLAPPGSVTYLLVRESTAITATQQNEYDEAAANYREIIRVAEAASPGAYQGEDWADYGRYGLAETYFSQAKYAAGVKVLEVLMSSERDSPWVRNGAHLCASCYAGTGRIEEGIALLEGTIRRHPHTQSAAAAQIAIGHLRARQGRPDLALQAYQRVLTDYADVAGCEPVRAEAEFNIKDTMAEQKGGQP
jgi:tetratricopeptide (TPR) repeat protein